jgi:FMN phosphatase YigB (HAD superfamily)
MENIKVLAFDTGGTVLDWHAGLTAAFAAWGAAQGIERDWHVLANEHRRRSLHRMINTVDPGFNIGDVHRDVLGELLKPSRALSDGVGVGWLSEEFQALGIPFERRVQRTREYIEVMRAPQLTSG